MLQSVKAVLLSVSISLLCIGDGIAAEHSHQHHHDVLSAPIGIMGDHVMPEGDWMMSYRFMRMAMQGNRTGTDRVSTPLGGYMVSPLSMTMDMHMLGAMYGFSDAMTVMLMVPFISTEMDHQVNMNSMLFTTQASAIGDATLAAVYDIGGGTLLNAGLSLATGSIDERDVTPASMGNPVQLPYPMQTGSGTNDLILGVTHVAQLDALSVGVQGRVTLRLGDNDRGYTLGNRVDLSAWLSKAFSDKLNASLRIKASDWGNIDGADSALNPMMVPTADPDLRAGTRIDALVGINFELGEYSIGLEYGVPVQQDLDGPQLETDSRLILGVISNF